MSSKSGGSSDAGCGVVAVSCRRPKDIETGVIFIDHATAVWRAHVCRSVLQQK